MKPPLFSCLTSRVANNGSLYGRFLFGPLPIDLSLTVATVLRRSLLHNKATFTIVSAEIEGASHEYASLPGIQESVLEILLNLGEIVLTGTQGNFLSSFGRTSIESGFEFSDLSFTKQKENQISNAENETELNTSLDNTKGSKQSPKNIYCFASIRISGPCIVTANSIQWPKGIFCVKPDAYIATISSNETFHMRIKIACSSVHLATVPNEPTKELVEDGSNNSISPVSMVGRQTLDRTTIDGANAAAAIVSYVPTLLEKKQEVNSKTFRQKDWDLYVEQSTSTTLKTSNSISLQDVSPLSSYCFRKRNLNSMSQLLGTSSKAEIVQPNTAANKREKATGVARGSFVPSYVRTALGQSTPGQDRATLGLAISPQVFPSFISTGMSTKKRRINYQPTTKKNQAKTSIQQKALTEDSKHHNLENQLLYNKTLTSLFPLKESVPLDVKSSTYPVEKVNFLIERDDELAGYRHRIILEVWTNGSISPRQAIADSIGSIMKLIYSFREPVRKMP